MNENMDKFSWIDGNGKVKTLRILGHWFLVRRCLKNEDYFIIGEKAEKGKVINPSFFISGDTMLKGLTEDTENAWCEILAIGANCGKSRTEREMRKFKLPKGQKQSGRKYDAPYGLVNPSKIGDCVMLPFCSKYGRMFNNITGSINDICVDEIEIKGYVCNEF